jgi:flavorubredoxin
LAVRKITDTVINVGVIDWDRQLFDELIPLPDGTSYNSYFIFGSEKNALIDTSDPAKSGEYFRSLDTAKIERIDYIIANHAEQDHSGLLPHVLGKYPNAKIVTNEKCKGFLKEHLLLQDGDFITVVDGETLSLGNKTLQFHLAPWVHWPETMFTYLIEEKILFSCDFLGSHFATAQPFSDDSQRVFRAAKRYYAEIMMPFRSFVKKHLAKVTELSPSIICPSHGPSYSNPRFILSAYQDWVSEHTLRKVVLPFVSMHGSTKVIVEYLVHTLSQKAIEAIPLNMVVKDLGELAIEIVDASTIVLGVPTMLLAPQPQMLYTVALINALKPKTNFLSVVNSYGWATKTNEIIRTALGNLKAEWIDPIEIKGFPKASDFELLSRLTERIVEKNQRIPVGGAS